jgi:rubrerythrin
MDRNSFRKAGNPKAVSRRKMLLTGAAAGAAGVLVFPTVAERVIATPKMTMGAGGDVDLLNNALFYEHQAIWAYSAAAGKLTSTDVGKAVLALALRNQNDHKKHRDALAAAVKQLGGTPVAAQNSYDVSSYIKNGEGNLDSDVNIAKLALALETDAAIAYTTEVAQIKTPGLISAAASIGSTEASHAAAIRATFKGLGVGLEIVPSAFVNADNRSAWVLKV